MKMESRSSEFHEYPDECFGKFQAPIVSYTRGGVSNEVMEKDSEAAVLEVRHQGASSTSKAWDWFVWLGSVVACSVFMSRICGSLLDVIINGPSIQPQISATPPHGNLMSRAAPLRRRSSCGADSIGENDYHMNLRVAGLFIILFISSSACAIPVLAVKFPGLKLPSGFLFAMRHFGTGVLLATAFAHLLPTAFILLGDSCLPSFWTEGYPAMPGAIALAGIFLVTMLEMIFHPSRNMSAAPPTGDGDIPHSISRAPSTAHSLPRLDHHGRAVRTAGGISEAGSRSVTQPTLTPEQEHKKEIMQCVLLELGILFHSVFIGMALSVAIGNEFVILLIAISFHQTFEGLALGSRIAAIDWPKGSLQPIFMSIAYGCTTPIGQAIGLATRSTYSPESETGLMLVGIMNALSAGLLIFASLVELLSEDFLSDGSWRVLVGRRRVYACLLVLAGAFGMALVGAWA